MRTYGSGISTILEDVIKGKGVKLSKKKAARQAIKRLQCSSSERQPKPISDNQKNDGAKQKPE